MPKVPYPYEVNGKLVRQNGSLIPICSLLNCSLLPSLTVSLPEQNYSLHFALRYPVLQLKLGLGKQKGVMSKIKSLKTSADKSLSKVRGKTWSKPLGKTLKTTADILAVMGKVAPGLNYFLPGAGTILGGVLCAVGSAFQMGSLLLHPKTSKKDLQKDMNEMKQKLKSIKETDEELKGSFAEDLREGIKEMEEKIANPILETG